MQPLFQQGPQAGRDEAEHQGSCHTSSPKAAKRDRPTLTIIDGPATSPGHHGGWTQSL